MIALKKMKTLKTIFKITEYLILAVLIILLAISVSFSVKKYVFKEEMPKIMGYSYSIIVSGSMEPTQNINDLIITKEKNIYEVNDIITFKSGNKFVTHRIIEATDDGFITKGDANNVADTKIVTNEEIEGSIVFVIPKAGVLIEWVRSPLGVMIMVIVIIMLVTVPYLTRKYKENKERR